MKGKSADVEFREKVFQEYRRNGGNAEMTIRAVRKLGHTLSKPALYDWIEKFNFKERMAAADAKDREAKDASTITEARLLADLLAQKQKYETYFESQGKTVDNQAMYAYQSLVKTIVDIKAKITSEQSRHFLTFMRDLVTYLSKEDPEAVPFLERNFDDFIAFAKEKYGAQGGQG